MSIPAEVERANKLRWDLRKEGHYEVYYITLNHTKSSSGFWIRYTLNSPGENLGAPYAQIWFSYFNAREPQRNFALKRTFPIDEMRANAEPFHLRIGDCELSNGRVVGGIDGMGHEAFWDINFKPAEKVYHHLPGALYLPGMADTAVLSPNLRVHFDGVIRIDGTKLDLKSDPGCQTHLWGRKHAHRWTWAHVGNFAEDHTACFEGLCVQVKRLEIPIAPLTFFTLTYRGKEYRFNEFHTSFRARSRFSTGLWHFRASQDNILFLGEITAKPQDMVTAEYTDPDGEKAWCHNSETGSASIKIFKRKNFAAAWKPADALTCLGAAHVEYAARRQDPDVRAFIEETL